MEPSNRSGQIAPSATLSISARATELNKQGKDVIDFGAGEPDFNTPTPIKEAGKRAIDENFTHYTAASGIPELKQAIQSKFERDQGLDYDESQITVGCGAKHVLFNIMATLIDPGDEVIIFAPYWVSYPNQIRFFDGEPKVLKTQDNDFQPDPGEIRKAITDNTKALILNSPSNPTGAVIESDIVKKIAEICEKNDVALISDEIYEKLSFTDTPHLCPATLSDDIYDNTIVVNGVSKAYSMTGWRIGYAAGPEPVIQEINKLMSHSTSNPASISQKAALEALNTSESVVEEMRDSFRERRGFVHERLNEMPHISCVEPLGAFYAFPDFSNVISSNSNLSDDQDLAMALLDDAHVAIVPGSAFGAPGYIRLSYAASRARLEEGLNRMEEWIREN